jgi:hypothetical protein
VFACQVLVVDDFADLTPDLVMSAYVEALYRAREWEYERLTLPFWKDLLRTVARDKSSAYLDEKFPPETTGASPSSLAPFLLLL